MIDETAKLHIEKVTVVYTMYNHLGDFVVIGGLLKKFDLLNVKFESLAAHLGSPYVSHFDGVSKGRFFNIASYGGFFALVSKLRRAKREGRLIFGVPMAPGSIQAFIFFWILKKLGALSYIVDFNLINADIITPPRRRYIYDRHLAQAAELFRHPEWLEDSSMPLALVRSPVAISQVNHRIGFFPWSGRRWLAEFQWPESHWHSLARLILENPKCEIVLFGKDPGFDRFEHALNQQLPEELRPRFLSAPATSVHDLVATAQGLDCLITVNTSALHLAHALKLPIVALCGSSAEFWLPEGDHVHLVRDRKSALPPSDKYYHDPLQPSLQRISVAHVYAAYEEASRAFRAKPG
jgi:ADP-heptose:LPS heptosyltransferase